MTTSALISQSLASHGVERKGENAIYAIVADEHNVHCMTHELLNTWWEGLSPEEKGEIFERETNRDVTAVPALQHAGLSALSTAVDTIQTGFADIMERPLAGLSSVAHADGLVGNGVLRPAMRALLSRDAEANRLGVADVLPTDGARLAGNGSLGGDRFALCCGESGHAGMLRASGVDAVETARG